jgi:hypothetical protein
MRRPTLALALLSCLLLTCATSQGAQEKDKPKVGRLPHVTFDAARKQVRVECEALEVDAPLEFFCVLTNTSEHESVLRTPAKPSHIHTALLAIGLQPGKPVEYSESLKKWLPAQGPPLRVTLEYVNKGGKPVTVPGYRCMREIRSKKEMKPMSWVFAGSRVMEDGSFAADVTGYVISVVNFDLTLIDIPEVASNSNELLEWERNPDVAPPGGTKVTMVIEPAGDKEPARDRAAPAPKDEAKEVSLEQAPQGDEGQDGPAADPKIAELRQRWLKAVRPHATAMREAAQAHYEVIGQLRREQQRLIDEADRIQRAIDLLEQEYQDATTPRPAPAQ